MMRVDEETELVVLDAEGRETSYRATLMPERRHKAANVVALASLGETARAIGGKVVRASQLAEKVNP
jgi:hypothetical protein